MNNSGDTMKLQELKDELLARYTYRIELHAHTSPASGCSEITPTEMVAAYKRLGYDAVVITNHFMYTPERGDREEYVNAFLRDFEETQKLGEEQGIRVYLGAELRFTENNNDYLLFGVDKELLLEIYDWLPGGVENFRKNYAMPNSVFLQAHPMRNGMQLVDPSLLDGIEVFNMHLGHNSRVGKASAYAKENDVRIVTAGTDFHHKTHEGMSALRSAVLPKDSFELAEILKSGDYLLEIGRNNLIIP